MVFIFLFHLTSLFAGASAKGENKKEFQDVKRAAACPRFGETGV